HRRKGRVLRWVPSHMAGMEAAGESTGGRLSASGARAGPGRWAPGARRVSPLAVDVNGVRCRHSAGRLGDRKPRTAEMPATPRLGLGLPPRLAPGPALTASPASRV